MMQIRIDENGLRIGPRPIGEAKEKMIPTYRLTSGAGVNLEMTREIVTRVPFRSSSSSWYFTRVTELIPGFKSLPFKCLAEIINSNCRENTVQSNEYKAKHEFFFQIVSLQSLSTDRTSLMKPTGYMITSFFFVHLTPIRR
jgi:hypothetical protein